MNTFLIIVGIFFVVLSAIMVAVQVKNDEALFSAFWGFVLCWNTHTLIDLIARAS